MRILKLATLAVCALAALAGPVEAAGVVPPASPTAGREALVGLLEGNLRFVTGHPLHPHSRPADRLALAHGQHPRAVVVCCADSRVSPELLFDQGLGDLFVVRVAGNTIESDVVAGSVAYAVDHLGVPLVLVVGHERCGAVEAVFKGGHLLPAIAPLLKPLARNAAEIPYGASDPVDAAVDANVVRTVERLQTKLKTDPHHPKQNVLFVGARYDLDTGTVALLDIRE